MQKRTGVSIRGGKKAIDFEYGILMGVVTPWLLHLQGKVSHVQSVQKRCSEIEG